ncbi:MAG: hypothetical protein M5U28_07170 [Sandaracinaceae bacterium]|nr:hypothetical protein [Sandaracinaceae bacterium]
MRSDGNAPSTVATADLGEVHALEGRPAEQAGVEQHPEGVDVGAAIHQRPAELLGGHEARRADGDPGGGEALGRQHARDAEVEEHGPRVAPDRARQEDVRGLDVAVDDPGVVNARERARERARETDRLGHGQRPAREPVLQRLSVEQLEDLEGPVLVVDAEVQHLHDAFGAYSRRGARLSQEPLGPRRVVAHRGVNELHRHAALEHEVVRAEDRPHASVADQGAHTVLAGEAPPSSSRAQSRMSVLTAPRTPARMERRSHGSNRASSVREVSAVRST